MSCKVSINLNQHIAQQYNLSSSLPSLLFAAKRSSSKSNQKLIKEKIVKLMFNKDQDFRKHLEEEILKLSNVNYFFKETGQHENFNLLFYASQNNCMAATVFLLRKGADPSLVNNKGTTVLHFMAKKGQVLMAKICLLNLPLKETKSNFINGRSKSGCTPLILAVENNHVDFVKLLLSEKALVNATIKTEWAEGWTAMHAASKKNNLEIIKLLLNHGGDKNITASHKNFKGKLKVEDVTTNEKIRKILNEK
jgi:ankyrin repeat protein